MNHEQRKLFHSLVFPLVFLFIIWAVYLGSVVINADLSVIGIYPQKTRGLAGIILSPFAHGNLQHILSNSWSFLVLSVMLFYFYRLIAYKVFFLNWIISGVLLWIGGRSVYHIGASGLVYGLAFFIFFSGVFRTDKNLRPLSLVVVFLYGGMVWGLMPQNNHISWEGHLYGAMSGIALAWYYRKKPINFVAAPDGLSVSVTWGNQVSVDYHYIESNSTDDTLPDNPNEVNFNPN